MATSSKTNVLIYSGAGVSTTSLGHLRTSLRKLLSPRYDVLEISAKSLIEDPWSDNCALLAFPGGRDLGYVASLGDSGCKRISDWVHNAGGRYLGICAGAYFACARIEFEVGRDGFEVAGDRPLKFYKGVCTGSAYPGFAYDSEEGARNAVISLESSQLNGAWPSHPSEVSVYHNGGGYFEEPASSTSATVIARYHELDHRPPAGLICHPGTGKAILWGVHPEHPAVMEATNASLSVRPASSVDLVRASLSLLDLHVPSAMPSIPGPTPHLLVSNRRGDAIALAQELAAGYSLTSGATPITLPDLHDTFKLHARHQLDHVFGNGPSMIDGNIDVIVVDDDLPSSDITPVFNLQVFYEKLRLARVNNPLPFRPSFGSEMLYGEVVTSTQTVLEKNPRFQSRLPSGFVFLGSHQIAGRGRGSNNWLSPPGCLQFSLLLRADRSMGALLVFAQYLFGLAVVEAVRTMPGYEDVGLRLKWPNDLYADMGDAGLRKVGGILVSSSFAGGDFTVIIGCGVNTTNASATAALCELIAQHNMLHSSNLPIITQEELLARILGVFEARWNQFEQFKSFEPFSSAYYSYWLHSDRIVTIEENKQRVKIVGIAPDTGCLRTVLVNGSQSTDFVDLQPNGNSFDMMQGLIRTKR